MPVSAQLSEAVANYINKPSNDRTYDEVEVIFPWFIEHSKYFESLKPDVVKYIIRHCEFAKYDTDDVIIRQFDVGDRFYIILSGSVSIYVNTEAVKEENEEGQREDASTVKAAVIEQKKATAREKFGNHVATLSCGASFGELALINKDCVRNASVIADCPTELIAVNRVIYNNSLREIHLAEFHQRKEFVDNCPLFDGWHRGLKRQVAMSLKRIELPYNAQVVRQGEAVSGLKFLLSGQVLASVDILMHQKQYPTMMPKSKSDYQECKTHLDGTHHAECHLEPLTFLEETEKLKKTLCQRPITRLGYNVGERRNTLRHLDLAIYSQGAVFGELEYGMNLPTYCFSAVCVHPSVLYVLDAGNFDRLINSRRNPNGWKQLRASAAAGLSTRFPRVQHRRVPLFQYFNEQAMEARLKAAAEERERLHEEKEGFRRGRGIDDVVPKWGPLIDEYGPGTVFYRNRERRLAAKRKALLQQSLRANRNH